MNYKRILKTIAEKENVSVKEVENEMAAALTSAGITCSVQEFLEKATDILKRRLYIV